LALLNHHTWSIHQVSRFAAPLRCRCRRRKAPWCRSWPNGNECHGRLDDNGMGTQNDDEGDYFRFRWVNLPHCSSASTLATPPCNSLQKDEKSINNSKPAVAPSSLSSSKRPFSEALFSSETAVCIAAETTAATDQQHLLVEVMVREELTVAVLLCFPTFPAVDEGDDSDETDGTEVTGFDFCLCRGHRGAASHHLERAWKWLESSTGCVVSRRPFRPNPSDLACAVAIWTRRAYHSRKNSSDNSSVNGMRRPLVVTFEVPEAVRGRGLDTLSITIPPAALLQLCRNIEKRRPSQPSTATTTNNDLVVDKDGDDSTSGLVGQTGKETFIETMPMLGAIHCYVREAFRVDVSSFPLVKASCDAATFGCDGRCKLQGAAYMASAVLAETANMVRRER